MLAVVAALVLAGCGNSRPLTPNLSLTATPNGFRTVAYRAAGVSLRVPRNWAILPDRGPLVVTVTSGQAVIALWRYPRPGTYPTSDPAALGHAQRVLLAAARQRDRSLRVIRAGNASLDGNGGIILSELERINGRQRRVRSEHIYLAGAEVVLEEYAPPSLFGTIDHLVFSPVRRSLHLLAGPGGAG